MSTKTIEQLQQIVANETLSEEDRRQAAEHILKLQQPDQEPAAVDPAVAERRAQFTGAQRRLAAGLTAISKGTNLIDSKSSEASVISDKLVTMQIWRLMLDNDGSDGLLYAVTNWNSKSTKTLADRRGNPEINSECNPQWRLGMQPSERRAAYIKKQCDLLRVPYLEPQPELKLDAKVLVRMSSEKFAEFVVEFHRMVLQWDLKAFVYSNLSTPAAKFFAGFLEIQKQADAEEESLFKNAMAAHMLATAPDSDESDAEDFLGLLAWMGQRERLEAGRLLERIAKQKSRGASTSQAPAEWTIKETAPKRSPLDDIDLTKVGSYYDLQIAKLKAEQDKLEQQAHQEPPTA